GLRFLMMLTNGWVLNKYILKTPALRPIVRWVVLDYPGVLKTPLYLHSTKEGKKHLMITLIRSETCILASYMILKPF
ncbi:13055_t:CDS:1, partial [Gigaspora rosea]